ncbi:MAG: YkvA family protein [Chloroflexota bacterium]
MFRRIKSARQLLSYAPLSWRLFQDARVPRSAKVVAFIAIVAAFSPLDLLEWLPIPAGAGSLAVLLLVLRTFVNAAPEDVRHEHMRALGIDSLS